MREFLNAPNGKQSCPVNERLDADPSQSPLGGRTVRWDFWRRDHILSLHVKQLIIQKRLISL